MKQFLTILLLLGISIMAHAQTELQRLTVIPLEAPRTVAVYPDHPDKASLIFVSTQTNLRFDSQMDGIMQIRDESAIGRYILIIEHFTQIISITAPGYIQERLRIGSPQASEVRYFRVAPEDQNQDVISVIFNVSPADARVMLYRHERILTDDVIELSPDFHSVEVSQSLYDGYTENVRTVRGQNVSWPVEFVENLPRPDDSRLEHQQGVGVLTLISIETMVMSNKRFKQNYNSNLYGLSLDARFNLNHRNYFSFGAGILGTTASFSNPISSYAFLSCYFLKTGLGRRYKYFFPEIDIKYGAFKLLGDEAKRHNIGYQTFVMVGSSITAILPYNFEIMGSYGILTYPKVNNLFQLRVSYVVEF